MLGKMLTLVDPTPVVPRLIISPFLPRKLAFYSTCILKSRFPTYDSLQVEFYDTLEWGALKKNENIHKKQIL